MSDPTDQDVDLEFSIANGEENQIIRTPDPSDDNEVPEDEWDEENTSITFLDRDCSTLWINRYHKPNVNIGGRGWIRVTLGAGVRRAQLRHAGSGGVRIYKAGRYRVPTGTYVLSLHGSTYGRRFIQACISYTRAD